MAKYAILNVENIIENIIEWDGDSEYKIPAEFSIKLIEEDLDILLHIGDVFGGAASINKPEL